MRKDAGNEMMKFISYSNHDANKAEQAHKLSQGSNSPINNYNAGSLLAPGQNMLQLNHGPGSGNLPNIQQLNMAMDNKDKED